MTREMLKPAITAVFILLAFAAGPASDKDTMLSEQQIISILENA